MKMVPGRRHWDEAEFAEVSGSGPAAEMLHSLHHIEPYEGIGFLFAHRRQNALVVVDGIERRNAGVAPSMIENQFPAARLERFHVGLRGDQNGGEPLVCGYPGILHLSLI